MTDVSRMTMDELVEYHRVKTNVSGEPWLRGLPVEVGRLLAAMGYLETYAGQIAGPWIEGVMTEGALWRFTLISSFHRVDECVASIQRSLDALQGGKDTNAFAHGVNEIWIPLRSFVARVKASTEPEGFAWQMLMFLIATMVMRQDAEAYVRNEQGVFVMESDSTCRDYIAVAIARAGACPFGCRDGAAIGLLRQAVISTLKRCSGSAT